MFSVTTVQLSGTSSYILHQVVATIRVLRVSSVLQNHSLFFSQSRAEWREVGTTVETVDVEEKLGNKDCVLVDTPATCLNLLLLFLLKYGGKLCEVD